MTNNNQQSNNKPAPTQEVLIAMVQGGLIEAAKILALETKVNYQHPVLILAGVSKGLQNTEAWLKRLITKDESTIKLKDKIRSLAPLDDNILIQGESGTGKELVARALAGDRTGKFIALNCAGMPEHLIESELFGHVAGAFTDARTAKTGLMREAQNGTLFLDEIGDLNPKV